MTMTHSRRAADHGDLPPGCPYSRGSQLEFALAAFHMRVGSGKGSVGVRAGRGAITPSLIPQPSCRIDRILSGSAFLSTITPNQGSTISSEVRLPHTTSFVGSGLYGLFAELSCCATTTMREPFRTRLGSSSSY